MAEQNQRVPLGIIPDIQDEIDAMDNLEENTALQKSIENDGKAWSDQTPPDIEYEVNNEVRVLKGTTARGILNAEPDIDA